MGQGGQITLVNGTERDWNKTNQHSYQMNTWDFPATIPAGTSATVYMEWDQGTFVAESDDSGDVTYTLSGTSLNFQVQARAKKGFDLQVLLTNIATSGNPQGSTIDLGWNHDGYVVFILSGKVGNFTSSNIPTSWMQDNLSLLGKKSLRQICIPGSHDAGMSSHGSGTAGAFDCNILTQTTNIGEQLQFGSRYFDIRPVISAGQYLTGHYSQIGGSSWQGANGQSIESIINDVNTYTAKNKELVILYLSHDLNTDLGNDSYAPFTQEEWNKLLAQMKGLHNLFIIDNPANVDLTTLTLNKFISDNRAAAIVVVEPSGKGISLGNYANQGFYTASNFPVYNQYSGTNDLNTMANDQLAKMKKEKPNLNASYFLLSWTLTQSSTQAATCVTRTESSILDLANQANPRLYDMLLPACSEQCYPNILYIDNVQTSNIAALAMAVNS